MLVLFLKRVLRPLALVALFFVLFEGAAFAADTTLTTPGASDATFSVSPQLLAVLIGLVTPLLTGVGTKLNASVGVKALVSFVIVAILAVINEITTKAAGTPFNVWDTVYLFFLTLVSHAASYFQIWAPMNGGSGTFTNSMTPAIGFGGGPGTPPEA